MPGYHRETELPVWTTYALVVVMVLAVTGCAGTGERSAVAPMPAVSPSKTRGITVATGLFIKALAAIDRNLTADQSAAVDSGLNTCLDLTQGKTREQVTKNTAARFEVDRDQAAKIVAAAERTLCRSF
jgi:Protein of unknown function (DUF732)